MSDDTTYRAIPRRATASRAGMSASTLDIAFASLEIVRVAPGVEVPAHAHDSTHLCFVFEGEMLERDGPRFRRLGQQGMRVSPAGDAHEIRSGERGFACLVIRLAEGAIADAGIERPHGRRWLERGPASALAARLLAEARRADDASPIAVDLLATELLAVLQGARQREPSAPPSWLAGVRERLADDPRCVPTLAELAEHAGVSRAHLARAFRGLTGRTVGGYVRTLRVERARALLLHTDLPLSRVAYEAGFADQSHMTRLLGGMMGITPGRLRRRVRGRDATPVQDGAMAKLS